MPIIAPQNVTVKRVAHTSMEVSWLPLSLAEARGFVSSYTVAYWSGENDFSHSVVYVSIPGNQTTFVHVVDGLHPDLSYQIKVWANTSAGAGMASEATLAESLPMTGMALSLLLQDDLFSP